MNEQVAGNFIRLLGASRVLRDEPMSAHTSFRVGGPADLFVRVSGAEELREALQLLDEAGMPFYLLGRGTNLLVGDGGYRGCIVTLEGTGISVDEDRLTAGAGESLSAAASAARDHGLAGLEFASGIPGSVGGALMMNAGAYGGSMDQVVESVLLLQPDGSLQEVSAREMRFSYRRSILKETPAIALEAVLRLRPDSPDAITARMQELSERRRGKQPLDFPSAGSTFKRPEGSYAGKLIMEAGLRGFRIGGAAVSEKHCGFVINCGGAAAADVRAVIREVRSLVHENSGIWLEEEVISLGDFGVW